MYHYFASIYCKNICKDAKVLYLEREGYHMTDILLAWAQLKANKNMDIGIVTEEHTNFLFYMTCILNNTNVHQSERVPWISEQQPLGYELEVGNVENPGSINEFISLNEPGNGMFMNDDGNKLQVEVKVVQSVLLNEEKNINIVEYVDVPVIVDREYMVENSNVLVDADILGEILENNPDISTEVTLINEMEESNNVSATISGNINNDDNVEVETITKTVEFEEDVKDSANEDSQFDDDENFQMQRMSDSDADDMYALKDNKDSNAAAVTENIQPSVSSANAPKPMYNEEGGEGIAQNITIPFTSSIDYNPDLDRIATALPEYAAVVYNGDRGVYRGALDNVQMYDMQIPSNTINNADLQYLSSASHEIKLENIEINKIHVDFSHPNVSALYYQGYSEECIKQAYHIFLVNKAGDYNMAAANAEDCPTFVEDILQIMKMHNIECKNDVSQKNHFDILWENFICFFWCKIFNNCFRRKSFVFYIHFIPNHMIKYRNK